jgi:hypothetical protein
MYVGVSYSEIIPGSKLMGPFHFAKRHWHSEETRPPVDKPRIENVDHISIAGMNDVQNCHGNR